MRRVEQITAHTILWLCGAILLIMMLQITLDVLARQGFGAGLPATADIIVRYSMVALALLPMGLAELYDRHITVTVFSRKMPARVQAGLARVGHGLSACVYGVIAYATTLEALRQTGKGAFIEAGLARLTTWPSYWLPPLSFACIATLCLVRVFRAQPGPSDTI